MWVPKAAGHVGEYQEAQSESGAHESQEREGLCSGDYVFPNFPAFAVGMSPSFAGYASPGVVPWGV